MTKVTINKEKVLSINIYKVTLHLPDGTTTSYNNFSTTPNLGKTTFDLLGHHFTDKVDTIVEYLEEKRKGGD